jgi:hypothetical protein
MLGWYRVIRHCDFLEGFSITDTFKAIFQAQKCNKNSTANLVSDSINLQDSSFWRLSGLQGNLKVADGKKNHINGGVAFYLYSLAFRNGSCRRMMMGKTQCCFGSLTI